MYQHATVQRVHDRVQELLHEAERVTADCASSGLPEPNLGPLTALWADVQNTQHAWAAYFELHAAVQELGGTSWYAVRDRLWQVEEFVAKWVADPRVAQAAATPAVVAMLKVRDETG